MLLIPCPWCGPRSECEFVYGGDASVVRPSDPDSIPDREWLDYIYLRRNIRGWHNEWWFHQRGCGQWFSIMRDTVSHQIAPSELLKSVQERPTK
jgi:sarcosine oxidase, subunit delta